MRDAIRMSIDHLKEKAHKDKKVLVVVTDGNDNASVVSLENLVKASQQSEVLIYAIGLLGEEERREAKRAQRALKALAEATGGEVFFPKDVGEVDKIAHQVAQRYPQPVHHRIHADQYRHGRHVPPDQDHRQGSGQSHRPYAQRLLRHSRPGGPSKPGGKGPSSKYNAFSYTLFSHGCRAARPTAAGLRRLSSGPTPGSSSATPPSSIKPATWSPRCRNPPSASSKIRSSRRSASSSAKTFRCLSAW